MGHGVLFLHVVMSHNGSYVGLLLGTAFGVQCKVPALWRPFSLPCPLTLFLDLPCPLTFCLDLHRFVLAEASGPLLGVALRYLLDLGLGIRFGLAEAGGSLLGVASRDLLDLGLGLLFGLVEAGGSLLGVALRDLLDLRLVLRFGLAEAGGTGGRIARFAGPEG